MFEYKLIFGIVAVIISFIAYIPYFFDIFKNKTKPHTVTWLIWTILVFIAFLAQIQESAGPGALITASIAAISFIIFLIALRKGETKITKFDMLIFILSILAIIPWALTNNPLISIILVTIIDSLGFLPTFRKSYFYPEQETVSTYFLIGTGFLIGILALEIYSLVTWLYPASLVVLNYSLTILLIIRQKKNI